MAQPLGVGGIVDREDRELAAGGAGGATGGGVAGDGGHTLAQARLERHDLAAGGDRQHPPVVTGDGEAGMAVCRDRVAHGRRRVRTITAGRTGFSRGRMVALAVSMLVRTRLAGGSGSAIAAIAREPSTPTKATADWSALKARLAIAHGRCQ